jgi:hypothetical protein
MTIINHITSCVIWRNVLSLNKCGTTPWDPMPTENDYVFKGKCFSQLLGNMVVFFEEMQPCSLGYAYVP